MSVTYNATGSGVLRRIRTPAPHDVLSGRGGSVNAHPGNCQFRDWISTRKTDYNLASSKQDKAVICREVISKVTDLGGRFLAKETAGSSWWIELDDERVMAKTSQALREGAPKIREAHREELGIPSADDVNSSSGKRHRVRRPAPEKRTVEEHVEEHVASGVGIKTFPLEQPAVEAAAYPPSKRVRIDYKGHAVLPNDETPPLSSTPAPAALVVSEMMLMPAPAGLEPVIPSIPPPRSLGSSKNSFHLSRAHSLAMSDGCLNPDDISDEFVNPFEDESELLGRKNSSNSSNSLGSSFSRSSFGLPSSRTGVLRESSTASTSSDMAGLGALMRSSDSSKSIPSLGALFRSSDSSSNNNNNSKTHTEAPVRLNSNNSSRYATDEPCDNASVGSQATVGMPIWEWFDQEVTKPEFMFRQ